MIDLKLGDNSSLSWKALKILEEKGILQATIFVKQNTAWSVTESKSFIESLKTIE